MKHKASERIISRTFIYLDKNTMTTREVPVKMVVYGDVTDKDIEVELNRRWKQWKENEDKKGMSKQERYKYDRDVAWSEAREIECPHCDSKRKPTMRLAQYVEQAWGFLGGHTYTRDEAIYKCVECSQEFKNSELVQYRDRKLPSIYNYFPEYNDQK
jgi:DNA-directed RNA polymerase subunit RPC12/RpoP